MWDLCFLLRCIVSTKSMLPINKSISENSWFTFDRPSKRQFFIFHFFILMIFCQRSYKKITFFLKTDVKSSYNLLRSHKNLRSKNFSLRNDCLLKYFVHFHGNAFSLVIFTKWKNYCNSSFKDTYKMCCCYLFY